ncbi:MFS general substrate transporter [Lojkania enalia]|uniref:MFS general substrate transporter n=1 Tax=Lojkania enalia TaxID=147567 RepID=A0A9P4MUJ3_9PLEO|nr:MFS general substrate transporter [Didymosphaeria enalia]
MSTEKPEDDGERPCPSILHFTVFTSNERRYLTYLLGYLTLASSLTATIYFPLIEPLSHQYDVSIQAINLTITLYVVFQALSPGVFAPISDSFGRRPVLLITFFIYCVASLGLSFNTRSYIALLLLRALQSIGGSAVISLAYAVVADVSVPAERGKILGPMLASTNLGPCFGPVIGGSIALSTKDTQWCFWVLLIFGASSLCLIGWTMPETGRSIVGNGAVRPHPVWRTWWSLLMNSNRELWNSGEASVGDNVGKTGVGVFSLPNPFSSLRLICYQDTSLTLWSAASPYAVWYCIQISIPIIFSQQYGYDDLFVSLCFLSGGTGVILGGFLAGRLMDRNYKKVAEKAGLLVNTIVGDDLREFPIEIARSRGSYFLHLLSVCALAGYGWAIECSIHPSVPLIFQFFIGMKCTIVLQWFSTLIVDIFPRKSGTAAASNNIMRCTLSAIAVALLQPLQNSLGKGWMFTLIGLIDGLSGISAVWLLQSNGLKWRRERLENN